MVIDIINKKKSELLEELNRINDNISKELLLELESFSNRLLENPDELNKVNIEEYVNKVYKNRKDINKESVIKTLNALKAFIDLKENSEPGLFELNDNQIKMIYKFGNDIKEFVNNAKENRKQQETIREEHNKYNVILNKLVDNKKINKDDLSIITGLVEEDKQTKIELLKEILEHNLSIEKQKRKTKKEPIIDIETVIKELQKNETNEKKHKQIEKQANKYKDEIECNYELKKCEQIIEFLKEKGIYNKFSCIEDLMAVLLYGDLESVTAAYEEFKNADFLNKDFIYSFPGLWTKQKESNKSNNNKINNKNNGNNKKTTDDYATLKDKIAILNRDSLYRKIKIYNDNNIDPFEEEDKCITLFIPSEETIKRNIELYRAYNVKPTAGIIISGKPSERCDQLIECELLNPNIDLEKVDSYPQEEKNKAYANINPSFIPKLQPGHVFIIADLLEQGRKVDIEEQNAILDSLFTKRKYKDNLPRLTGEFSKHFFGYDIDNSKSKIDTYEERCKKFLADKELVTSNKEVLKDYEEMLEESKNYECVDFKQETLDSNFIKRLDKEFKSEEDFYYLIEGRRISRRKVLRIYEALQEYNKSHPDNKFNEERMGMFAITYGTYFKPETFYSIITIVQELKRGENTNEISHRL